jgi:hypothetical protein
MIGTPYNPDNCTFLASQALNANQFNPNVPDTGNLTTHNLLWDFVENKMYWVDTKTNLIVQELSSGGTSIGIAEVDVTFVNTGANYFARFGGLNVISGNPADFTITPAPNPTTSDTLTCIKEITQCYGSYYFQCISQPGGQRVFASLFGGPRSAGGAISFPLSINNARMSHQVNLGYVQSNQPITSTLNWSGSGTLTNNSSKLIINYIK